MSRKRQCELHPTEREKDCCYCGDIADAQRRADENEAREEKIRTVIDMLDEPEIIEFLKEKLK